jgi:phospholipid/cholesterol/gamma-HCH transport system substrate-binding protein
MPGRSTFAWREIRVLLLVGVGLLLLIYGIYRVGKIFDVFASRYTLVTLVADVAGLREGAPVTIAGQRVGQVSKIEFIPVEQKRGATNIVLHLDVAEDVKDQIRRDSRAFMRSQGLLGDKYVDISPGTKRSSVLQPMDTLIASPVLDLEQLMARGSAVLDSASKVVASVGRITSSLNRGEGTMGQLLINDELYIRMSTATSEMQAVLEQFGNPDGTMGMLLRDRTLYTRMLSAVTKVDSLGGAIVRGQGTFGRLMQSDSLYRTFFRGANRADSALANISGFLNKLSTSDGVMNKMLTDPKLYDEFLKSVVDLQTLIAEIRANPKKYVPPVQVKVF